jgi:hypothetical protein
MSSKPNHRRGEPRRQDHGPTWESPTPSAGCNSTHVARSRSWWKKQINRVERRTGGVKSGPKYRKQARVRPPIKPDEE